MSVISRLRRDKPYLTPPFVPEDEQRWPPDLFDRFKMPRGVDSLPIAPGDNEEDPFAPLKRPYGPLSAVPPLPEPTSPVESEPIIRMRAPMPPEPAGPVLDTRMPSVPDDPNVPIVKYRGKRPQREFIDESLSPEEKEMGYRRATQDYKPQKEGIGKILLRTGLGFIAGGIPGAAYTAGNEFLNRRRRDEDWKEGELKESDQALSTIQKQRQAQRQARKTDIDIETAEEKLDQLRRPKPVAGQIKMTGKGWAVIDPVTKKASPIVDDQGNQVTGKLDDTEELIADPNDPTVLHKTKNGQPTGVTYKVVPGYGNVPSGQAYNADTARESKVGEAQFTNEQIDSQISALKARQQAMGGSPPLEIEKETTSTNEYGEERTSKQKVRNPDYEDWRNQYNKLQGDIDTLEAKRKFVPGKLSATEQKIYDAAKSKNLDPDEAVKRYRSGKY